MSNHDFLMHRSRVRFVGLLAVLLVCIGCGGGTSGTGGGAYTVSGTLRTTNNSPLGGIGVRINSAGARAHYRLTTSDVTDGQGQFVLELDQRPDSFSLRLTGESFESDVTVAMVPPTAVGMNLAVTLDPVSGRIENQSEEFDEPPGHDEAAELE